MLKSSRFEQIVIIICVQIFTYQFIVAISFCINAGGPLSFMVAEYTVFILYGQCKGNISPLVTRRSSYLFFLNKSIWYLNSLWPSDAIWSHRSGSTLVQLTACCLTTPSHYLNQCWLNIPEGPCAIHLKALTLKIIMEVITQTHFDALVQQRHNSIATHWSYVFLALSHRFENYTFKNKTRNNDLIIRWKLPVWPWRVWLGVVQGTCWLVAPITGRADRATGNRRAPRSRRCAGNIPSGPAETTTRLESHSGKCNIVSDIQG